MTRVFHLAIWFCALAASPAVWADSLLIKNARLITLASSGVKEGSDLLIENGVIKAIGKNLPQEGVPKVIDATDMQVTPGLVLANSSIGLIEITQASKTLDMISTNDKRYSASFEVEPAINFNSTLIPQNRLHGMTHAIVRPVAFTRRFAGQGAAIRLNGAPSIIASEVAVYASYGATAKNDAGGSRAAIYTRLRRSFQEGADYRNNRQSLKKGRWRSSPRSVEDLDVLVSVLEGQKPFVITVNRADDIRALLVLQKEFSFKLVIAGAAEAWMVAEELGQANAVVILDPLQNIPQSFDHLGVRLDNAVLLHENGVKLIFSGVDNENAHIGFLIRQAAGNVVAEGLPYIEALKAVTLNPAQVFGFGDQYGTLEVGKQADLVVWDGDPLEIMTSARHVVIGGEPMPMVARSTRLRDRYKDLNPESHWWYRK